jgi:hypothetical protein
MKDSVVKPALVLTAGEGAARLDDLETAPPLELAAAEIVLLTETLEADALLLVVTCGIFEPLLVVTASEEAATLEDDDSAPPELTDIDTVLVKEVFETNALLLDLTEDVVELLLVVTAGAEVTTLADVNNVPPLEPAAGACTDEAMVLPAADADDDQTGCAVDAPWVCVADLVAAWLPWPLPTCERVLFTEEVDADVLLLVVTDGFVDTRKVADTLADATELEAVFVEKCIPVDEVFEFIFDISSSSLSSSSSSSSSL